MVKTITDLTPEQLARIPSWVEEWIAEGLRTDPADREKFEKSVADCYTTCNLTPPKQVVWVMSPVVGAFVAPTIEYLLSHKDTNKVNGTLVDDVLMDVGSKMLGKQFVPQALKAIHEVVNLNYSTKSPLPKDFRNNLISEVQGNWYKHIGGQFWVSWHAYIEFCRQVCELEIPEEMAARTDAYMGCNTSVCQWWPYAEFVVACDRPSKISRDAQGRLHSTTGQAIEWRDGWGLYQINGVALTDEQADMIIHHPEKMTPKSILDTPNAEIRRVMLERYGYERFVQDLPATKVMTDDWGTLWKAEFVDDEPLVMVELVNSTPEQDGSFRKYFLRVPPGVKTAHEAVAWANHETVETYHPQIQT